MNNKQKKKKYDIFISYRKDGGEYSARVLYEELSKRGYRVFFDVETLRSGYFNTRLYQVIEECDDFLMVLSPGALDRCVNEDDWVRQELGCALKNQKNVIPVMLRNFQFPKEMPAEIEAVRYRHGISADTEFFNAFLDKLEEFLHAKPMSKKNVIIVGSVVAAAVLVVVVGILIFQLNFRKNEKDKTLLASKTEAPDTQASSHETEQSSDTEKWVADGVTYTGKRVNGVIDGYGKAEYDNGYYEGDWVNGKREGTGTYYWTSGKYAGDRYEGEWVNDKEEGTGTYYYGHGEWDGDRYEGEWKNGEMDGTGTYYYANEKYAGDRYEGEWKSGEKDGIGTYYYGHGEWAGDREEGEWKNGKQNGSSYYIKSDGSVTRYQYKDDEVISKEDVEKWTEGNVVYYGKKINGVIEGKGKAIYNNGYYDGDWVNGKKEGIGTYYWTSGEYAGDRYEGEWVNDNKEGTGTYYYGHGEWDGDRYEGEWKNGEMDGTGTYYDADYDGITITGTWKEGEFVGE